MALAAEAPASAKMHEEEAVGFLSSSGSAADSRSIAVAPAAADLAAGQRFKLHMGRKLLLLAPVALASVVLVLWSSDPTIAQRWLPGSLQGKWLYRHDGAQEHPEDIADCVFDSMFGVENTMAFGLSLNGAVNSCPAVTEADDASKDSMVQAAKSAHQARITVISGDKKKETHAITSSTLKKVEKVLAKYKKSGIPKKHPEKKAALEDMKDAVQAFSDSKELADIAEVDRRVCAADVSGVLSRLAYVTAGISHLTSECSLMINQQANCAGDISRLLAGITMIASSGAEISASCTEYEKYIGSDIAEYEFSRRLKGDDHVATVPVQIMIDGVEAMKTAHQDRQAAKKARDVELTVCVTASWFAATFLARFLDMNPAVKHCGNGNHRQCAASVIDIFSALSWTASSIAYAVSECLVKGQRQSAFCAAGITKLVAAAADTAAALSVVSTACYSANATSTPPK